MEGRINSTGQLYIKRGVRMKQQHCPFQQTSCACGDWCPHFEEPVELGKTDEWYRYGKYALQICNKKILFINKLEDER